MSRCDLLVTGAGGFVGRHLVQRARDAGMAVCTADWDLRDAALTRSRLQDLGPQRVAHLASSPRGGDPAKALAADEAMLTSVLEAAGAAVAVLAPGSAAQYGMGLDRPLTEEDPLMPLSSYGRAKCALETLATARNAGQRVVWARAFNHIGPGQGEDAPTASWARQIAEAELAGGGTLRTGALHVVRDFLDVRDVADAYIALLTSDAQGAVNVCSGDATPLQAIVDILTSAANCEVQLVQDPALRRATDPPFVVGDPSRLRRLTGWRPTISLATSVAEQLDDWRRRVREPAPIASGAS